MAKRRRKRCFDSCRTQVRTSAKNENAGNNWNSSQFNIKGPGKRGNIVAETLLLMTFPCARKLGNICCGHKICDKCRARGQTGKHLCRHQCVCNNVSSFARALTLNIKRALTFSRLSWRAHQSTGTMSRFSLKGFKKQLRLVLRLVMNVCVRFCIYYQ